jgi:hypothetical protein
MMIMIAAVSNITLSLSCVLSESKSCGGEMAPSVAGLRVYFAETTSNFCLGSAGLKSQMGG